MKPTKWLMLGILGLGALGTIGCESVAKNPDDRPQILSIRLVEGEDEENFDVSGSRIEVVDGIQGQVGACRDYSHTPVLRDLTFALYVSTPNVNRQLDVDAFFTFDTGTNDFFPTDGTAAPPRGVVTGIGAHQVVFTKPGSAEGTVRILIRFALPEALAERNALEPDPERPGLFRRVNLCGASAVEYSYTFTAIVSDIDDQGDAQSFPLTFIDNSAFLCQVGTLC